MFKTYKILSLALSALIALSATSACGGGSVQTEQNSPSASSASSAVEASTAVAETVKSKLGEIEIMADVNVDVEGGTLNENKYLDYIEEQTGVRIKVQSPGSSSYTDKVNIVMASGDAPDAVMIGSSNMINQLARNGVLTNVEPYVTDSGKYPLLASRMPEAAYHPVSNNDSIWGVPYARFDAFTQVTFVRKDWMAKLDLQPPATLDDLYAIMKAFTEEDPDGNGIDDTYGLLGGGFNPVLYYGGALFRAIFDCNTYQVIEGEVLPWQINPNYKEYLKYMRKLADEEIMDSDILNSTTQVMMDKLATHKYGLLTNFWHANQFPGYDTWTIGDEWTTIDIPKNIKGEPGRFSYETLSRHYAVIPSTSKKIDLTMTVFDWVCSDEGVKYVNLGVPGSDYIIDEEGKPQLGTTTKFSINWIFTLMNPGIKNEDTESYLALTYPQSSIDWLNHAAEQGKLDPIAVNLPYNPDLIQANIDKVVEEYTSQAILGNIDIDATWDKYISDYMSAGGRQAVDFNTQWYNSGGKEIVGNS
ncbi:MAG: extracellular solute-binding protein [Clostridiales bacterium]|jgi:putative aldouronate transport system substrate-binding protein|nr:extracellular solute-binding protein [Clostridiales bacterium]